MRLLEHLLLIGGAHGFDPRLRRLVIRVVLDHFAVAADGPGRFAALLEVLRFVERILGGVQRLDAVDGGVQVAVGEQAAQAVEQLVGGRVIGFAVVVALDDRFRVGLHLVGHAAQLLFGKLRQDLRHGGVVVLFERAGQPLHRRVEPHGDADDRRDHGHGDRQRDPEPFQRALFARLVLVVFLVDVVVPVGDGLVLLRHEAVALPVNGRLGFGKLLAGGELLRKRVFRRILRGGLAVLCGCFVPAGRGFRFAVGFGGGFRIDRGFRFGCGRVAFIVPGLHFGRRRVFRRGGIDCIGRIGRGAHGVGQDDRAAADVAFRRAFRQRGTAVYAKHRLTSFWVDCFKNTIFRRICQILSLKNAGAPQKKRICGALILRNFSKDRGQSAIFASQRRFCSGETVLSAASAYGLPSASHFVLPMSW